MIFSSVHGVLFPYVMGQNCLRSLGCGSITQHLHEVDMAGTPTGVVNVRYRPASYAHLRCERNMSRHIRQVIEVHHLGILDTRPEVEKLLVPPAA